MGGFPPTLVFGATVVALATATGALRWYNQWRSGWPGGGKGDIVAQRLASWGLILLFALGWGPAVGGGSARTLPQPAPLSAPIYTGDFGLAPCVGDGFVAFTTPESAVRADLNGDGDTADFVVRYHDLLGRRTVNTGAITAPLSIAVGGSVVAFVADEGDAGLDLNGDGDAWDDVVRYYDVARRELVNIGVDVWSDAATDGTVIAFSVLESRFGDDLNGDGDKEDIVLLYLDVATRQLTNTKAIGDRPSVRGGIIAVETFERDVGQDLDRDGDATDTVIRYYDLTSGVLVNTGVQGFRPVVGDGIIAFLVDEFDVDEDLNGDGDTFDDVVHYYDLGRKRAVNVGWEASRQALSAAGAYVLFEQFELLVGQDLNNDGDDFDDILFYYDLATGEVVNTGVAALFPCGDGWAAYFSTFEEDVGADLNGDGQVEGFAVGYVDLPARLVLKEGWKLIGLPRGLPPEGLVTLLSPIGGKYEMVIAYDASNPSQPWRVFAPFQGLYELPRPDLGDGLWIKMAERGILPLPGPAPETTEIQLRPGWNLIGHPARTARPVRAALASIEGKYDAVYAFAGFGSTLWQTFVPNAPEAVNTLKRLEPGRGYWINMLQDAVLRVTY